MMKLMGKPIKSLTPERMAKKEAEGNLIFFFEKSIYFLLNL